MKIGELTLDIIINYLKASSDINKFSNEVSSSFKKAESAVVSLKDRFANLGLTINGIQAVFSILKSTVADFINSANKQEIAVSKLNNGLKNVNEGFDAFYKLTAQAEELQKITPFSDEDIINAQAMLTTFMKSSEEIQILTPRILDLAAAYMQSGDASMSLQQIAVMLGKVNEETIGTLRRVGVAFTKEQEEKLKSLTGTKQAIYLAKILDQNFKDIAITVGSTTAGKMKIFQNSIDDLKEALGSLFINALLPLLSPINSFINYIKDASPNVKIAITLFIALSSAFILLNSHIPSSVKIFSLLSTVLIALPNPIKIIISSLSLLSAAFLALRGPITLLGASLGGLPIIIGLIATAITGIIPLFSSASKSVSDFKTSSELSKVSSELSQMLLLQELHKNKTKLSEQQLANYNSTLLSLAQTYPQIISSTNSHTGALELNEAQLSSLIAKTQEYARIEIAKKLDENTKAIINNAESFFKAGYEIQEASRNYERFSEWAEYNQKKLQKLYESTNGLTNATNDQIETYKLYADAIARWTLAANDAQNKQSELEQSTMSNLDAVSKLLAQYISLGEIIPLLANLRMETGQNSQAIMYLNAALGNLGAAGFAAFNGINSQLVQHTSVFKAFADSWNLFVSAVQSGNLAAVQSAYANMMSALAYLKSESVKIEKSVTPTKQSVPSSRKTKSTSDYKKEIDEVDKLKKQYEKLLQDLELEKQKLIFETPEKELEITKSYDKKIYELKLDYYKKFVNDFYNASEELKDKSHNIALDLLEDINDYLLKTRKENEELLKIRKENEFKIAKIKAENDLNEFSRQISLIELEYQQELFEYQNLIQEKKLTEEEFNSWIIEREKKKSIDIEKINKERQLRLLNIEKQLLDLNENQYIAKSKSLQVDYQSELLELKDTGDPELKKRQDEFLKEKYKKDLSKLKESFKQEIIDTLLSGLNQGISLVQQIGSLFGLAADSFIAKLLNGLQQAVSIISSIFSFIATVAKFFSLAATPASIFTAGFASGGLVPGYGDSDSVPALLTPGEFVIRKSRVSELISKFGTGFLTWLNGGSLLSANSNNFSTGGLITDSNPISIHLVAEDKISGENIYKVWHIIDSKRNKWKI